MTTATLPTAPAVPLLENGAHLDCDEFLRRYEAMPEINKAQLIEGVVYMPSPVRASVHGTPHAHIQTWLGVYTAYTLVPGSPTTPPSFWIVTTSPSPTCC